LVVLVLALVCLHIQAHPTPTTTPTPTLACAYGTCGACVEIDGCGWCATSGTCQPGHESGPTVSTCASWEYYDCCTNITSCSSCINKNTCGWCGTTPTGTECFVGNSSGPQSPIAGCHWNWNGNCPIQPPTPTPTPPPPTPTPTPEAPTPTPTPTPEAPTPTPTPTPPPPTPTPTPAPVHNPCPYSNCDSCTDIINCGWCSTGPGTGTCVSGHESGPSTGTCTNWEYYDCCTDITTCSSCVEASTCGWCGTALTGASCFVGTSSGPTPPSSVRGTCSPWNYYTCPGAKPQALIGGATAKPAGTKAKPKKP